jgi:glyoxylase-like metal-dependent hydrolase (beta-lactamase superfamily II)
MENFRQVAQNVYQINALDSLQPAVKVYFIPDKYPALVDTGPTAASSTIMEALHHIGYEPASLAYIFLTHIHMDHGGGAGYLAQQLPQVKVVVHPRGMRHLLDPSRLIAGTQVIFGADFPSQFGPILPVSEHQIQVARDEEVFLLGETELKVIYSPGHAPHHICFYESKSQGLFVGEAMGIPLPEINFALPAVSPPEFDLEAYLNTLSRLRSLAPEILFYAHGGAPRETNKYFQLIYESLRKCLSVISRAVEAGETLPQFFERFQKFIPGEILRQFDSLFSSLFTETANLLKQQRVSLDSISWELHRAKEDGET